MEPTFMKENMSDDENHQHKCVPYHLKMVQYVAYPASSVPTSTFRPYGPNNNACCSSIAT